VTVVAVMSGGSSDSSECSGSSNSSDSSGSSDRDRVHISGTNMARSAVGTRDGPSSVV